MTLSTPIEHVYGCLCGDCAAAFMSVSRRKALLDPASLPAVEASADAAALPTSISALLYPQDWRWNADYDHGTPITITYSFMTQAPSGYSGFRAFNETEKAAARKALAEWAEVADITFREVSSGGQIAFGNASLGGPTGYTTWKGVTGRDSGWKLTHADVLMNGSKGFTYTDGADGVRTLVHEIGHALGLKHTFDTSGPTLSGVENTAQYSVMSYANPPSTPNVQPTAPQMYDIAAIQYLYGANKTHATGDTIYQWLNSRTELATVWDAGGADTFSAENQTLGCTLDLRQGKFSSVGPYGSGAAKDNVAIAQGTVIERAVGGKGADTIIGNEIANVIVGGLGADRLTGGDGADSFCWRGLSECGDVITDFRAGIDKLVFDPAAFGMSSVAFQALPGTYTGGNGGGTAWNAGRATFLLDSTGTLYWDGNGASGGYTKVASFEGGTPTAADIVLSGDFTAPSPVPTPEPTPEPAPEPAPRTVTGTNGNDTLSGIGGEVTMKGGWGHDTYLVDSSGDLVVEYGGQGVDTVRSSIDYALGSYVENLVLTGSDAIDATGSSWHNRITGNDAANTLKGLAGNDTIKGQGGNDLVLGGSGKDVLSGGTGTDTFAYLNQRDGAWAKYNLTKGGVKGDTILDFQSGTDRISLDDQAFMLKAGLAAEGVNFATIGTAYNGTNSNAGDFLSGRPSLVFDSTGTLYYDPNGKGAGYTVLTTVQLGANVHASDIIIA